MQSWLDITLRWVDQSGPSRGDDKPDDDDDDDDKGEGGGTPEGGRR